MDIAQRLTDAIVKRLPVPATGNRITYDADVKGFGARVTATGSRAFILGYWTRAGRQRRYTIGGFPDWSAPAARDEARRLKRIIDAGGDPLADIEAERAAPTVNELIDRFVDEYLPRKRRRTREEYERLLRLHIRPALGRLKVAEVRFADIDILHRRVTKAGSPIAANRAHSLVRTLFACAIRWQLRTDNPARGIERNPEHTHQRYLTRDELGRLTVALGEHEDRQAADIFRLLLLTGCRIGEALTARFEHLDLVAGTWRKPAHATKQGKVHVVPLSAAARELLTALRQRTNSDWVFPGDGANGHRIATFRAWTKVKKAAGITGLRLHDLRHSFASELVSGGASLPLIGALLGHSNPATTSRYSHLYDDPLRAAVERVGHIIGNGGRR